MKINIGRINEATVPVALESVFIQVFGSQRVFKRGQMGEKKFTAKSGKVLRFINTHGKVILLLNSRGKDTLLCKQIEVSFRRAALSRARESKKFTEQNPAPLNFRLNEFELEFARGVLSTGWIEGRELLFDGEFQRIETSEEAAIGCFCGPVATAFLSTSRAFLAGKLAAEAQATGEDVFAAMPCDNK